MADDMCGPSNGAKNLLSHVNRDRSLHQDRIAGGPSGASQSFRNQRLTGNGDANYESFLSAQVGGLHAGPIPGMTEEFSQMNLGRQVGPGMGLGNQAVNTMDVAHARAANAGMSVEQYQRFLQGMNGQPGVAQSSIANPFQQTGGVMVNPQTVMGAPVARHTTPTAHMAGGNFMAQGFTHPMSGPLTQQTGSFAMAHSFGPAATTTSQFNPQAAQADPALAFPSAAYDAAFAEFDDGEFEEEVGKWMDKHGPAAELAQRAGQPTADEWNEIDANMQQMADAADAAREAGSVGAHEDAQANSDQNNLQAQQELVKAATDILTAVSDNQSDKFKNSTFLELMRRIRAEEITIQNNALVDVQTGAEIPIPPAADDGLVPPTAGPSTAGNDNAESDAGTPWANVPVVNP
ncbi:hypothetical protein GE09DRAFT_743359 [Coniochaeta sp. 2T2.1]|nr:hypothetical protein GE09DRAFT_743359 [Coniochaeta sp. 2T2.1]